MDGYITVKQAANRWKVTPRQIQLWCKTNKVCGAIKWGRDWAIPESAVRPPIKHKSKPSKDLED